MSGVANYPNAAPDDLKAQYVGRTLQDIDGPAAIVDVAAARQNCQVMLDAADSLGVLFRAHVKTHKVGPVAPENCYLVLVTALVMANRSLFRRLSSHGSKSERKLIPRDWWSPRSQRQNN